MIKTPAPAPAPSPSSSPLDMEDKYQSSGNNFEGRIKNIIRKIKKDRTRAGYQNILTFIKRRESNIEMDDLKEVLR